MAPIDSKSFPLVMISAMYENGGNTTHRILDGHPELFVYPFESQIGSRLVNDRWSALYPVKYRWPVFALDSDLTADYFAIIDEEGKVRSRTPYVSKFREYPFEMNDDERRARFIELMTGAPRTRANLVSAFFAATFDVWHDLHRSGREHVWVGYSPIFGVDAERFIAEMPQGHILHVVRNPWSAYADTKKRPVPLSLAHYVEAWVTVQMLVLSAQEVSPERVTIVRFEDICEDSRRALMPFCERVGIDPSALVTTPTWNAKPLNEIYPWGTIRRATPEQNAATAAELSTEEKEEVARRARTLLATFSYTDFLEKVPALGR